MRPDFHKARCRRKGQALAEFALIIPLFMLLLCGVIDFGFIFHEYLELQHAAREGGRLACVGADASAISLRVLQALGSGWDGGTVSTRLEETDRGSYSEVTLTLTAPLFPLTPMAGSIPGLADGITAHAAVTFRKE